MFIFENVDAEDKAALKAKGDPSIPGKRDHVIKWATLAFADEQMLTFL